MVGHTNGISRRLGHLLRQVDPTPDAELLARFVDGQDGEAFALLVSRHGPMVHGVCRRLLRNDADADDAFQATFLVLARRAGAVRPRALLGNWLYGVAYRTALEARRAAAVRRARERSSAEMRTKALTTGGPLPDLREILDGELATLPDAFRAAIVLCDLEGLSRKDAALRLGWREGTLSGRLARGRSLLAARLSRHGLALPAAGLGILSGTATACVPGALVESTARLGILFAAGEAVAVAPAPVAALTEGVMKAMLLTKLKAMAAAAVVGCAILATAVGSWQANATGAGDPQAAERTKATGAPRGQTRDADRDRIAELERERDRLLKELRELRDRLAKLEAAQGGRGGERELDLLDEAKKLRRMEEERARTARGTPAKSAEVDPTAKLRRLEEEDLARLVDKEMKSKLKKLEEDRAKAAEGSARRVPGDDRVAALEDRLKQLEADFRKLLMEMERGRNKK